MIDTARTDEAAAAPLHPVLSLQGISKTFGRTKVLDGVDLEVRPGEVHCLLGHNGSGKSTLIKIIGGIHSPDPGGTMTVNGQVCETPVSGRQIHDLGIRFVHQSLGLIPSLTVAEHFAQDQLDGAVGWYYSPARAAVRARAALAAFDVKIDPDLPVEKLPAVDRAIVAIVRAVASLERRPEGLAGSLLVLDEPTSFLPRREVERLFETTQRIARQGAGVILITHDTDEVLSIADRVTVLRDGKVAGVVKRDELDRDRLVQLIVGHQLAAADFQTGPKAFVPHVDVQIENAGLAQRMRFNVGRGEIVGLTGLIGSGYADVVHALFGSRQGSGRLTVGDRTAALESLTPGRAIDLGVAFIPSDRAGAGAAMELTLAENAAVLSLKSLVNPLFFSAGALERAVTPRLKDVSVRPLAPAFEISRLSGGNQQKVVLAKWLAMKPALLLLDEPTQGIDIGAREQIFALLHQLVAGGSSILCASTDHDQLAKICDRVLILNKGHLVAELARPNLSASTIGEAVLSAPATSKPEKPA
ncbi:sugar ABC transporter ATP-binding protein [Mesorhizobium sp. YM1C-6-2]|uniref:sugar ABC transporter ATP-binding protein n=1 Tax=Mesorhizobium sp. YM1C-6-2 TaxID=1827501 RepID=UPI0011C353A3|nr:sugar ABC transporter ATP-binding protein [Mesorhizobium sp. YM1C-6-2]